MKGARATAVALGLLSVAGFSGQVALEWGREDKSVLGWGFGMAFLLFALVGTLVAYRRPANATGWAVLAIGALECIDGSGLESYGSFVVDSGGWRGLLLAWDEAANAVGPAVAALMLMVFPTGELLRGKRWRAGVVAVTVWMGAVFTTTYLAALRPTTGWTDGSDLLFRAAPAVLLLGCIAIVARFRTSGAQVRQQVKWVAFASALVVVALGALVVGNASGLADRSGEVLFYLLLLLSLLSMPVAIGIGILRYGLFDIDRLISRTVTYVAVMALLLGVYLGTVVVAQGLLRPVAGESDLAVAVSTLVAAALFRPVLRSVQRFVDRRFHRRRYDAQRTIDGFGQRLRSEVDLVELSGRLRSTVSDVVEPATLTTWFPPRTGAEG